jgi:hypothetical protein
VSLELWRQANEPPTAPHLASHPSWVSAGRSFIHFGEPPIQPGGHACADATEPTSIMAIDRRAGSNIIAQIDTSTVAVRSTVAVPEGYYK